jgi:succinate dehydrogenase / fumarate reductase cytochrome b subunit
MDTYQDSIGRVIGRDIELPVLHMPQMIALALGCSEAEIGLKYHISKATYLTKKD